MGAILAILVIVGAYGCFSSKEEDNPELALCRQFMELKNAGDPTANNLLTPKPVTPEKPLSPEETERLLDGQLLLRENFRIKEVHPEKSDDSASRPRFILVVDGGISCERMVMTPDGPRSQCRSLGNPDIVVEVRDGKIRGLRAQLHRDPNEKRMSAEDEQEFLEALQENQRRQVEKLTGKSK